MRSTIVPGTTAEHRLLHTVATFGYTAQDGDQIPDDRVMVIATQGVHEETTGLTMGDLRDLLHRVSARIPVDGDPMTRDDVESGLRRTQRWVETHHEVESHVEQMRFRAARTGLRVNAPASIRSELSVDRLGRPQTRVYVRVTHDQYDEIVRNHEVLRGRA